MPEEDGEYPELVSSDDEGDRRVQATTRARPPLEPPIYPVCFAPGISGCYWVKCHRQFTKPSTMCDKCGTSTSTVQYDESGCRARAALPMCGADDPGTAGVVIGPSHTVLTEKDKQRFDLHYDRLQASQRRQAEARAQRARRTASGPSVLAVSIAGDGDNVNPSPHANERAAMQPPALRRR